MGTKCAEVVARDGQHTPAPKEGEFDIDFVFWNTGVFLFLGGNTHVAQKIIGTTIKMVFNEHQVLQVLPVWVSWKEKEIKT